MPFWLYLKHAYVDNIIESLLNPLSQPHGHKEAKFLSQSSCWDDVLYLLVNASENRIGRDRFLITHKVVPLLPKVVDYWVGC